MMISQWLPRAAQVGDAAVRDRFREMGEYMVAFAGVARLMAKVRRGGPDGMGEGEEGGDDGGQEEDGREPIE